jgi:hypothetical protein
MSPEHRYAQIAVANAIFHRNIRWVLESKSHPNSKKRGIRKFTDWRLLSFGMLFGRYLPTLVFRPSKAMFRLRISIQRPKK